MTALAIAARQRRYPLVGWLWFLGTLVPMVGLVQVGGQAMAHRYAYLPLIGVSIVACWGVSTGPSSGTSPTAWLAGASAVVLLALTLVAHRQVDYWSDNVSLWTHTLQVTTPTT